jgi:hypothetical protein
LIKNQRIAKVGKILRGFGRTIHVLLELVLVLLIFVAFAIRTSWFQTWAAQQVASYLSSEWGTDVSIEKVDIIFFDRVDIEGIYVADKLNDTLLYSGSIRADIGDWSLAKSFVELERVELSGAHVQLKKYKGDTTFNFQHIVDYFAVDEPEDTSATPFQVVVKTIALSDINFSYSDQNAEPLQNGMDFSNLAFTGLSGEFSGFELNGDSTYVEINHLKFKERSGLILAEFSTKLLYSPEIISLGELRIGLNNSFIVSDYFQLLTPNGSEDFSNFVSGVRFNANIHDSRISLADVAYFVPQIWGMDDYVTIENVEIKGPVYGMRLKNTEIRMLDTTLIKGDFQIPNLAEENLFFQDDIAILRTSVSDIEKLNLSPFLENNMKHLEVPPSFNQAGVVTLSNIEFTGYESSFTIDGDVTSGIGNISSEYGVQFTKGADGIYSYSSPEASPSKKDLQVSNLNLGAISGNSTLGVISGEFDINGRGFKEKDLSVDFSGKITRLGLMDYDYAGITIRQGNFSHNVFTGVIDIEDDNMALYYDGSVDLKAPMFFDFSVKIDSAHLADVNLTNDSIPNFFKANVDVKIRGTNPNELSGHVYISNLQYKEKRIDFIMDTLALNITRGTRKAAVMYPGTNKPTGTYRTEKFDSISIFSPFVDVALTGSFDLKDIYPVLQTQLSYVVNNLVPPKDVAQTKNEYFDLQIDLKNVNPLLQFYDTEMYISEDSRINSYYNKREKRFAFDASFETILYHGMALQELKMENHFDSTKANINYQAQYAKLNDSLQVRNLYIDSYVKNNTFLTNLGWDGYKGTEPALFAFKTVVDPGKNVMTDFDPSFFFLRGEKWSINEKSKVLWTPDLIQLSKFNVSSGNRVISFDGKISENPNDWLYFYVENFDLSDLNSLFGGDLTMGGIVNIDGGVADIYNNIRFQSISDVKNFVLNDEEVGDLMIGASWDRATNSVSMLGNLKRQKSETFRFEGNYYIDREEENLRVELLFDYTDISFLSAFEDKDLYTDIEGVINGRLLVTGELKNPVIKGDLDVVMAGVHVPMFNVGYGFSGKLHFDDGSVTVDKMNLFDQEGNQALAHMSVNHTDWGDWNYDVTLDMDDRALTPKFLVMNTEYVEGSYYYGKAYITGFVNIFGYEDLVQIEVDATTEKGTDMYLPMFGSGELEESSFIVFTPAAGDTMSGGMFKPIDRRLGMTLDMTFNVTRDARVTIVFDPVYGDQIVVEEGMGQVKIGMDNYGVMSMFGMYTILKGEYNMRVKSVIKEDFVLVPQSTVSWNGSPYDADINIKAEFIRNVSLQDIVPPEKDRKGKKDEVRGVLIMTNTLMKPTLSFDITAPKSDQDGQDAVAALKADKDMLMKQFFSLLVMKKFYPIYGEGTAGGGGLGFVEDQINAFLSGLNSNVALSTDLEGGKRVIGGERQINERVTVSVSGGVIETGESSSEIVGDVRVEYRLNDDGSFTLNFFNETNNGAEAQTAGPFTQGVGMHYQETFSTVKDFKLLQGFLNIFRSKEKDVNYRDGGAPNPRRTPLPPENSTTTTPDP